MIKRFIFVFLLLSILPISIPAVPARPGLTEVTQPDGTPMKIQLRGDEHFNWIESETKEVLIKNRKTGYYDYAEIRLQQGREVLAPSGIPFDPSNRNPQAAGRDLPKVEKDDLKRMWRSAVQERKAKMRQIRRGLRAPSGPDESGK